MRREALKMYLFTLLSGGEFQGLKSPGAILKKATAIFAHDLPLCLGEMAQMAADQNGNHVVASAIGTMNEVIKEVGKRGVKAVWADLQGQYKRGMEANAITARNTKR